MMPDEKTRLLAMFTHPGNWCRDAGPGLPVPDDKSWTTRHRRDTGDAL